MKNIEMIGAYVMHHREHKYTREFWRRNVEERDGFENTELYGTITLKWI
jgi:hypothetical protein